MLSFCNIVLGKCQEKNTCVQASVHRGIWSILEKNKILVVESDIVGKVSNISKIKMNILKIMIVLIVKASKINLKLLELCEKGPSVSERENYSSACGKDKFLFSSSNIFIMRIPGQIFTV